MLSPQPGIFAQGTRTHHYLELDLRPGATVDDAREALARLREPKVTAGGLNLVIALGPDLMRRMAPGDTPAELAPFTTIEGEAGTVPARQHDAWLWLAGTGAGGGVDGAVAATHELEPIFTLAAEQPAYVYRDSRDMT